MGNFVEITEISLKDYYFGAINPTLITEREIPLEDFDFNNVPANIVNFRIRYDLGTTNNTKRYSMWIYNGESVSLERLKEIQNEIRAAKEENSAALSMALKSQDYLTNPFNKEIAILKTTDGKFLRLLAQISITIKNMEELGISRACQINNINFYPMNEECITLSEYLEIMRNKKLIPEFKNILDFQKAMKASILSLITDFKGQNYECFNHLDENGNWDFSWLDNAPIEVTYNLFMSCVQLVIGLKQQFDGEDYLRKQIADLFNSIVPKKNDESEKLSSERKLQYIMPDATIE